MDRSGYRMGGIALLLAGLAGIVGGSLHGPQPETLADFAALGARWRIAHVAIGLTGVLFVVSALALAKYFGGTRGEGWALLGTGTLLLGGVGLLGVGAWETAGFSGLLSAQEGGAGAAAEHAFLATSWVMISMAEAAGFLIPAAIAAYGLGTLKVTGWPAWVSWLGIVIGVASLLIDLFGIPLGAAAPLPLIAGMAWFGVLGVFLMGRDTGAAADVPARQTGQPAAT